MDQEIILDIVAARCRLAKYSNNTLKLGTSGNYLQEWTFPITEVMLSREQLNKLTGDPYTFNSWYNQRNNVWEPCSWWAHSDGEFVICDTYSAMSCELKFNGDITAAFAGEKATEKGKDDIPAARISALRLIPHVGGLTELTFHLHLRPGSGPENRILQEHQHRAGEITIGDAKLLLKGKQRELELAAPATPPEPATGLVPGAMMGRPVLPAQGNPDQGQDAQNSAAEAHSLEGSSNTTTTEAGQDEERSQASDDVAPEKSSPASLTGEVAAALHEAAGGDAPSGVNGGASVAPTMRDAGWPPPENKGKVMTPEEQAEFERAAEKQVEAYNARPGHVVDGTTSRSRKPRAAAH